MNIKQELLTRSPFFKLVEEKFPDYHDNMSAFAYAVEGQFRRTAGFGAIDGFEIFHIVDQTPTELKIVGLTYFLPSSLLPLEASFTIENREISYRVRLGLEDKTWHDLTKQKRWKAVYLYATEGHEPVWNWGEPVSGVFDC